MAHKMRDERADVPAEQVGVFLKCGLRVSYLQYRKNIFYVYAFNNNNYNNIYLIITAC